MKADEKPKGFDEWFAPNYPKINREETAQDCLFKMIAIQAWEASRATLAIDTPEDFTEGGNPNARILISHHREIMARWFKSIEAAGLKVKP